MSESNSSSGCGCGGIGIGSVVAGLLSYSLWHKIGWAIVAAIFNWAYVIYALIRYSEQVQRIVSSWF